MKILPCLTVCVLFAAPALAANELPPANIRVEVQMVAVPQIKALELLPNLQDTGSIDFAFSEIQKLIAKGEAKLIAWPQVVTKSGQRAVSEGIEELRYPAEFIRTEKSSTAAPVKPVDPEKDKRGVDQDLSAPGEFETRNVGATLEVEPVLSPDGKTIDFNLVSQHVAFLGFKQHSSVKDSKGNEWSVEQPQFSTAKTNTSLTVRTGQRILLATFRVTEPADYFEFFILRADVLPVPAGAAK